jgi:hypothetical protein
MPVELLGEIIDRLFKWQVCLLPFLFFKAISQTLADIVSISTYYWQQASADLQISRGLNFNWSVQL